MMKIKITNKEDVSPKIEIFNEQEKLVACIEVHSVIDDSDTTAANDSISSKVNVLSLDNTLFSIEEN